MSNNYREDHNELVNTNKQLMTLIRNYEIIAKKDRKQAHMMELQNKLLRERV